MSELVAMCLAVPAPSRDDEMAGPVAKRRRRIDRSDLVRAMCAVACAIALLSGISGPWHTVPTAAAAIGVWTAALVVTVFVLDADTPEDVAVGPAGGAPADLMDSLPTTVRIRDADNIS